MNILFVRVLVVLILTQAFTAGAQPFVMKKDLQTEWQAHDGERFIPFEEATAANVVYLRIRNPHPAGEYLHVTGDVPVALFVNNRLTGEFGSAVLNIDSLANLADTNDLLIAVYHKDLHEHKIETKLLSKNSVKPAALADDRRQPTFFHDFVIIGALILLVMVAVLIRVNPKLTSDYFSLTRIFSFREMEDAQIYTRIGSSSNILFYVYCSLLLGFYLMGIFHFVNGVYPVGQVFQSNSFGGAMLEWMQLSGLLLGLLVLKIIVVVAFSSLFGMTDVAGIHFFNWVRIIVVFFGILTLLLIIYFIWYGQDVSLLAAMLRLLAWITAGWIVLIFLKLTRKSGASMFHLFSYICATELIPFLFIIRVLYN